MALTWRLSATAAVLLLLLLLVVRGSCSETDSITGGSSSGSGASEGKVTWNTVCRFTLIIILYQHLDYDSYDAMGPKCV